MAEQRGIGAEQADKVEGLMIGAGQAVSSKLQQWSAPQAGIHDDALRLAGNVGKAVLGNPVGSTALRILGAAGEGGAWVGGKVATKMGVDPRWGKWTGGFIGDAALGGAAFKGLKIGAKGLKIGQKATNVGKRIPGVKGLLDETTGLAPRLRGLKQLVKQGTVTDVGPGMRTAANKLPASVQDVQIARKLKGDKEFISELAGKTTRMKTLISKTADKRGWANLNKYKGGDNLITTPKGEKFRYMWKDGRYSWRSMTSEAKRKLTRMTGEGADLKSITEQFKNHFNPKQAKEAAEIYVNTQRTVKKKIDDVIKKFNKGLAKNDPSKLSLEHITDVKFLDRIKKDVPGFSGRGANELQNLTILDLPTNMRTGALNKKMDHWQSVIDSVKTGKGFPDYDKSIVNFIYEDVGGMVADFKQKDWDEFLSNMITRQGDTAYDILIEMARKRN